jgi:hypothetical protein
VATEAERVEAHEAGHMPTQCTSLPLSRNPTPSNTPTQNTDASAPAAATHASTLTLAAEPRGGQHDERGREHERLLAADPDRAGLDARRRREQLVHVVALEDEEVHGHEEELEVHGRGHGKASAPAERQRSDVRVRRPHVRARVDAALEEQACVEADGGDGEEDGQAQPPALRQRVGDGPQPDPCMRPDTYGAANELVMQIAEQRSWNEALIYNQWFYTIEF